MQIDNKVYSYWKHCAQIEKLVYSTPCQHIESWRSISAKECETGKIIDQATIESLLLRGHSMVIAPQVLIRESSKQAFFIPYYLLAELNPAGKLSTKLMHALPIFPKRVLEGARLSPQVLATDQDFENHFALHPPIWSEAEEQLNWPAQLAYAQQCLSAVTRDVWLEDLQQLGFSLFDGAKVFPLEDLASTDKICVDILEQAQHVKVIESHHNSKSKLYIDDLLNNAWVEAAVKKAPPPRYVYYTPGVNVRYAAIPPAKHLVSTGDIEEIHSKLKHKFNVFYKGQQLLKSVQEITNRLADKYAEYSGIHARVTQLQDNYEQARAQTRLLQVLQDIWQRQVELILTWSKPLDFIPMLQRSRLARLYKFFSQNFPEDEVEGLNQRQLESLLLEKQSRAQNSERIMRDALHQVENDLQQQTMLQHKLDNWQQQHDYDISTNKYWEEICALAQQYWLVLFNNEQEYAGFFEEEPEAIEKLIVADADQVSPMLAASLLGKSKTVEILGSYDAIVCPNFSPSIDFALTQEYGIADCDADFEDLQFDGILGSLGNLWALATAKQEVTTTLEYHRQFPLEYTIIDVHGISQSYLGSRINFAEIDATVAWLQQNHKTALHVAIYTSFSGQQQCLQSALESAGIAHVKVHLLQEPSVDDADIVIFSPVYTYADSGPYNFDRGSALLDNMHNAAKRQLVVIGDSRIFKPQLHSAAGKFARLFIKKEAVGV